MDTSPPTLAVAKEDMLKAGRDFDPVLVVIATWDKVAQYDPELSEVIIPTPLILSLDRSFIVSNLIGSQSPHYISDLAPDIITKLLY